MGDDSAKSNTMCSLGGKVAIVTGASSGIGYTTAIVLCKLGAKLAITGRNAENLERVAKECAQQPGASKPLVIVADLRIDDDLKRIIDTTVKTYGKLDILVNNAGIFEFGSIEDTSTEQLDRIYQTNVRAVYQLCILASPHLVATKGNIVNVSSACATINFPTAMAYCMSKSALDKFTKCLSLGLAPKGVRVNCVNPGYAVTDIFRRGGSDDSTCSEIFRHAAEVQPIGRVIECEEVANAIAFLASDAASAITGEQLHVDGGYQNNTVQ